MTTGAFSQNIGNLISKLKLVTDSLLFIYAEANWEATERKIMSIVTYVHSNWHVAWLCQINYN